MAEPLLHGYNGTFSGEPFQLAPPNRLKVLCVMDAVELHPHPLGLSNCSEGPSLASGAPTLHLLYQQLHTEGLPLGYWSHLAHSQGDPGTSRFVSPSEALC